MTSYATKALLKSHDAALRMMGEKIRFIAGDASIELEALPGKSTATVYDDNSLTVAINLQDWILRRDKLVIGGTPIKPARGMSIEVVRHGERLSFAVHHPDPEQQPYRQCDSQAAILRVHTLLSETKPEPLITDE